MLYGLIGFILGGIAGVFFACLCIAAGDSERK